jgi:hypothetical protein
MPSGHEVRETTRQTVRELRVARGEIADVRFKDWSAELVRLGGDRYGSRGVIIECGEDSWRDYYDDGYDPDEALSEDASYAA